MPMVLFWQTSALSPGARRCSASHLADPAPDKRLYQTRETAVVEIGVLAQNLRILAERTRAPQLNKE